MSCDKKTMRLYAVTDRAWLGDETLPGQVEKALKGGATCIQLREKNLPHEEFLAEAITLQALCKKYHVPFIVNDDVDIAIKSGADGVHVGQSDMEAKNVRSLIGNKILGVSVQTAEQAIKAQKDGADYLGVGAVFSTSTKPDADSVSLCELKKITDSVDIPVVAIGGISKENMLSLKGSGIDGVALVSAIFASDNIEQECGELYLLASKTAELKICGAIFDLDGTLLDSMSIWEDAGESYLKSKGIVPCADIRAALAPLSLEAAAEYLKITYDIPDSREQIIKDICDRTESFYKNDAAIKSGVKEFLDFLKNRGVKMCIATATARHLAESALCRNGILGYFDRIFTCSEIGAGKDAPDIFNASLDFLGTKKEETWVFEDAAHSAQTAKNAGFLVCGVYDSSESRTTLIRACSDLYLNSLIKAGDYFD